MSRRLAVGTALAAVVWWTSGCETLNQISEVGTGIAEAGGLVTPAQAKSINRATEAVGKTFDDFTPAQEYYIGRTVAATLLSSQRLYANERATLYVNTIAQALALASDRPETYGGYHVLIMDSDDINAFAAPGGFILVSRGMLRCCRSEDQVAAVFAHEIGHVEKKHGLQAIEKGRIVEAITVLTAEAGKNLGGKALADLTSNFENSVGDIVKTMVNNGYSRGFERQADLAAVQILERIGYDPRALIAMLEQMDKRLKPGGHDFAKTHPPPQARIAWVREAIGSAPSPAIPTAAARVRAARFAEAMAGV